MSLSTKGFRLIAVKQTQTSPQMFEHLSPLRDMNSHSTALFDSVVFYKTGFSKAEKFRLFKDYSVSLGFTRSFNNITSYCNNEDEHIA